MDIKKTEIFDRKLITLATLTFVAAVLVLFNSNAQESTFVEQATAQENVLAAYEMMISGHSIEEARDLNEKALSMEPSNEGALYSLSRIYYILGEHDKSLEAIAAYKEAHPDKKRIHYIAGLSNAYSNNLKQAKVEFETFIDSGLSTWPGYLDLAWVHFQLGELDEAKVVLENGIEKFGHNVWLDTSLGGVQVALGEMVDAQEVLENAAELAKTVTTEEWHSNFSFNNPAQSAQEIEQMKVTIAFNLALARGEDTQQTPETLGIPFADPSPLGAASGVVVSACGDACPHTTCTPSNSCGDSNTGEYITCLSQCSVSAPAERSGYGAVCEAINACGASNVGNATVCTASGVACNVSAPSNPSGYGDACTVANACGSGSGTIQCDGSCSGAPPFCPDAEGNIGVAPSLVQAGQTTQVTWSTEYTTSCTVTAPNGDSWTGLSGSQVSSAIEGETLYTLSCLVTGSDPFEDSAAVEVIPAWEEF